MTCRLCPTPSSSVRVRSVFCKSRRHEKKKSLKDLHKKSRVNSDIYNNRHNSENISDRFSADGGGGEYPNFFN